jgi:hypothetical protein
MEQERFSPKLRRGVDARRSGSLQREHTQQEGCLGVKEFDTSSAQSCALRWDCILRVSIG